MAINKDEADKCIFDPKNPKDNENYEILLDIIKSEDDYYSLFTSEFFLQFISTTEIFQKDFRLDLKKKSLEKITQKSLNDRVGDKTNIYIKDIKKKYSFLKKISSIKNPYASHIEVTDRRVDYFLGNIKEEDCIKDRYIKKEDKKESYVIFSNCIKLVQLNLLKVSIFITLEENKNEFEKHNPDNLYPIYLKKMEDLEVLLETLETDLEEIKDIESHKFGYLGAIKIKNYFSIKNIELTNLKDKKEIYFVGGNGDGKTILLQAILLALKKGYSGFISEHIENIEAKMELSIKDEFATEYSDNMDVKNVFAYGINRNKVHYSDFDKYGYGGLFDTSDSRRTTYLKDPFYELDKKYKGKNPVLKEFIQVLNSQILRENYKIFDGGDVNFTELSEGYKSTIIWLYDLVSRLTENQNEIKKLKDFKAIVLIDEVDLYLHPKWKYNFVYNLRKVFPNIQFIMITHSTATVLGASKDAVFYKVYKENGEVKISQPMNSIKNLMANTLSTSPLFDMTTARARNSDENLKTDEDFIYTKIHEIIAKRVQGKKAIIEDEIVEMINKELDDYLKENGLL